MYDFANSGYTTVVLTAVFSAYFVSRVAGGASWATLAWTTALSASYAVVMVTAPVLGAWADRHAGKKKLLAFTTLGCIGSTAALAWAGPGDVWFAALLIFTSNIFYAWGEGGIAAFLPELATREKMGAVSGWGWSFGYIGGMLTLGICLAYVLQAQAQGRNADHFVPATMLITAVIYGLAACVTFALLRERARPAPGSSGKRHPMAQLVASVRSLGSFPDLRALLISTVCYQGGVAVAITLAAVYAQQVVGFQTQEIMLLVFLINIAAAAGAFLLGLGEDRFGHKRMLAGILWTWVAVCAGAALTVSKAQFWGVAVLAGLCMGSSQSIGRAMVGLFAPERKLAEFFGLWSVATRLASALGPLVYGVTTWVSGGNQRLAIGMTGILFVAGWVALRPVDVARGMRQANEASGRVVEIREQ